MSDLDRKPSTTGEPLSVRITYMTAPQWPNDPPPTATSRGHTR